MKRPDWYDALRRKGYSETKSARISNDMAKGHAERVRNARKAARNRKYHIPRYYGPGS